MNNSFKVGDIVSRKKYGNDILFKIDRIIGNKVYLADSNAMFTNETHNEYEWFYWELSKNITFATVKDNILYLCSEDGIYTLTKTDTEISSYWTTCEDNFKNPNMQKTTNKRDC